MWYSIRILCVESDLQPAEGGGVQLRENPVVGPICGHFLLRQPIHHSTRLDVLVLVPQASYFLGMDRYF
jgi:hypothetical protein